jgi:Na+-transporting NADH:ubiquinone oxidoreductase subunit C
MFSNKYIFLYSSAMVILVAAILSSAALFLKPYQERNIRTEIIMDILKSVNVETDKKSAEQTYNKYIKAEYTINKSGEIISLYKNGSFEKGEVRAFEINLKAEQKKLADLNAGKSTIEPVFPLFLCEKDNQHYYIIPLLGKGLWGPVWGNLSLEGDFKTVYGVTFGHKGETPGLGAEISAAFFQQQFIGKTIFDEANDFTSIKVVKGGVATLPADKQIHGVDAISGGTITSNGVSDMLKDCLINYVPFFKNMLKKSTNETVQPEV